MTSYEAQALVFLLGFKEDPESYRVFKMGTQYHGRYSGRALRLLCEAKAAGRVEEAKAALREYQRAKRQEKREQTTVA